MSASATTFNRAHGHERISKVSDTKDVSIFLNDVVLQGFVEAHSAGTPPRDASTVGLWRLP